MPVTPHPAEIRYRAHHFSNKRLVSFEQRVKKLNGRRGRIDGFYTGKLLIEMKSRGEA